jgi:DNA-binding PadR family transcriptional regulator
MTNEAKRSTLGLVVLWQLFEGPKHVYGLQKRLEQQAKDRIVNIRSRASLYQTLERLMRLGLVELHGRVPGESRPDRLVYAITEAGRETAREWLRESLRATGEDFPEFVAAVSMLFGLEPGDAQAQLELRAERLGAELAETQQVLRGNAALPRLFLLEEEYRRTLLRAELRWLRGVIEDLRDGRLTWSEAWLREIAAAFMPADEEGDA